MAQEIPPCPTPRQRGAQSKEVQDFFDALRSDDCDKVKELGHLASESFGRERTSSVIVAVRYGSVEVVKVLLQLDGALLTRADARNRDPAFVAVAYGNNECLQILLKEGVSLETVYKKVENGDEEEEPMERGQLEEREDELIEQMLVPECADRTLLHYAAYYGMDKCMDVIAEKFEERREKNGGIEAFTITEDLGATEELQNMVNEESRKDEDFNYFERMDENGKTALDLALLGINKVRQETEASPRGWVKCIAILLKRSASYFDRICEGGKEKRTLILDVPVHLLIEVFDQQIKYRQETADDKPRIVIDFGMISPKFDNYRILYEFLESKSLDRDDRQVVFRHPLMRAFVRERWQCICNLFYMNVILYVLHVLSLSAFITLAHCDVFYFGLDWKFETARKGLPISRAVLIITSILVSLNVVWLTYLSKRNRWKLEILINFSSCILSIAVSWFTDYKGYTTQLPLIPNASVPRTTAPGWVIHVTCLSVLMAWLELNLLVGRFPRWGAQALLFFPVLKNVCRVLITYGCMILGFSFVFFLEFRIYDPFSFGDPVRAFIKTVVMMMGEFDYTDMFGKDGKGMVWEASTMPFISRIIFLGFVVMASIALMNLMVGLAVSDTQELKLKGLETQLMKRAQSLLQWAYILRNLPKVIKDFFVRCSVVKISEEDTMELKARFEKRHHFPEELLRNLRETAEKRRYERKKKRALKVVRRHLLPLDGSVNLPNEVANLLNVMYEKICALSEEKQDDVDEHFLTF